MDLYHLRQGLHVIASSWDYHIGAGSRISVCENSVHFTHGPHAPQQDCHVRHQHHRLVAHAAAPRTTVA
jgi:hypothetical protein